MLYSKIDRIALKTFLLRAKLIFWSVQCADFLYNIIMFIYLLLLLYGLYSKVWHACDDIKIVVKVAEKNADRQHQNRVVKLRTIYM